ncbi:MAG: surface lipoprotein assembly modifier [Rubricella sp.]
MTRIAFALLAVFLLAAPVQAQTTVEWGSLSQPQRIGVLTTLIDAGEFETAQALLVRSEFTEGDTPFQAAYLQARILAATGNLEEAEAVLRRILELRPEFDRVRYDLAQVLAAQGNAEGAAFHLSILSEGVETTDERAQLEALIDRLGGQGGISFGGSLGILPSTNINSGTSATTINIGGLPFVISEDSRETSGVGLELGANMRASWPLGEALTAYAAGSVTLNDYEETRFDRFVLDTRIGLLIGERSRRTTVEAIGDRRWLDYEDLDYGLGFRVGHRRALSPRWTVNGEFSSIRRVTHESPGSAIRTNTLSLRLDRRLSATAGVHATIIHDWATADERDHFAYSGGSIAFGGYRAFGGGFTVGGEIRTGLRDYDDIFPSQTFAREDRFSEASISVLSSRFEVFGAAPRLGVTHTVQSSNVPFYDYTRTELELSFSREF